MRGVSGSRLRPLAWMERARLAAARFGDMSNSGSPRE
jgi:hypothetical protein